MELRCNSRFAVIRNEPFEQKHFERPEIREKSRAAILRTTMTMAKTKSKPRKGDGAKPVTGWALIDSENGELILRYIRRTRTDLMLHITKTSFVFREDNYGKTWTVRKVQIALID